MVLKLVTGKFKGKTLASSDTAKELRPTQGVVREAIVNMFKSAFLAEEVLPYIDFADLHILDLYSGTGSMGFEFLSNGAAELNFVDYDPKCIKLLYKNIEKLGLEDRVQVFKGQLPGLIKKIAKLKPGSIDLVFFDPPFKFSADKYLQCLQTVLTLDLLSPNALLLCEYKNMDIHDALVDKHSQELKIRKNKSYGDCVVSLAQKKN